MVPGRARFSVRGPFLLVQPVVERGVIALGFGVRGLLARDVDLGAGAPNETCGDGEGGLDPGRLRGSESPRARASSVHPHVETTRIPGVGAHDEREITPGRDGRAEALALPDDAPRVR